MVQTMFDNIAGRYDMINALMTFGLDKRWRKRTITLLGLGPSSIVLDLATGTGDFARELARLGHSPIGIDLSFGMLSSARPGNASIIQGDAVCLPLPPSSMDGIVSGFAVRNFADLKGVLCESERVLRPGGRLALLEIAVPRPIWLALGHRLWSGKAIPAIGALLSDREAYRYLPRSIAYLPTRDDFVDMVTNAGFVNVEHSYLSKGIVQVLTATKSSPSC